MKPRAVIPQKRYSSSKHAFTNLVSQHPLGSDIHAHAQRALQFHKQSTPVHDATVLAEVNPEVKVTGRARFTSHHGAKDTNVPRAIPGCRSQNQIAIFQTHAAGTRANDRCYCECMRNITVSVSDDTYKRARIAAAERDTSLSALVSAYLEQLSTTETETERLKRMERDIRDQITGFTASDRISRDELHGRR